MVILKGMEPQTDCRKCPFMATDGNALLSPMMCIALWATKHCVQGKILDDCPLVEIGVDIGDKDECVISLTPLSKEYKTDDVESEEWK